MALTLSDAVLRRLDLGTAGPPAAVDLDAVTRTMAAELGWERRVSPASGRRSKGRYRAAAPARWAGENALSPAC